MLLFRYVILCWVAVIDLHAEMLKKHIQQHRIVTLKHSVLAPVPLMRPSQIPSLL